MISAGNTEIKAEEASRARETKWFTTKQYIQARNEGKSKLTHLYIRWYCSSQNLAYFHEYHGSGKTETPPLSYTPPIPLSSPPPPQKKVLLKIRIKDFTLERSRMTEVEYSQKLAACVASAHTQNSERWITGWGKVSRHFF